MTLFRTLFVALVGLWALPTGQAQVTCAPVFPNTDSDVTIFFRANEGNAALAGVAPVYAHMGVITNLSQGPSDWRYVQTTWGVADADGLMAYVSPNLWSKTFNIRQFFGVPANETVEQLAFVFRNTDGSVVGRAADGGDIFYEVYPDDGLLRTRFVTPSLASFVAEAGDNLAVSGAASESAALQIWDNGTSVATATGLSITTNLTATSGYHVVELVATTATDSDTSRFAYLAPNDLTPADPPTGTPLGITVVDANTVRLLLYAPGKQNVFVIGDHSDWQPDLAYQMRRSLDGNTWWIELAGLTPGQHRFQYLVDGTLKVADPLSTLVLDPWNDAFIPAFTFPNLLPYPTGQTTGIVSIFETNPVPFDWQSNSYVRPAKPELVIYELLVRDFLMRHDYPTLLDTLDYLDRLGVTAIELMPVSEFDGNINWGYGPSFHKALDKYYGRAEDLKKVIDACHERGIAVILDVVFNQATGLSPLAQLYWDSANNRPAANNPWLNPTATHPFNVFNDFNHESAATKAYTKNCVEYWLREFRFDGFRFDLSKGFTQVNSGSNVGQWGQYDASRVAIWKDYADFIWDVDPTAYVILEHFADNSEEKELAEYGMMFWGNMWGAYKEVALGYTNGINTSLAGVNYKQRNWTVPHLIGYMESHDEDRIAYECKTFGNSASGHNVKSLPVAMRRIEMLEHLFYTVPGPKMLWQFGEMGYDFPINWCPNGTINPDCRTAPKPIRWDYLTDPYRNRLRNVTSALLQLRRDHDVFQTTDYQANIAGGPTRSVILNGSDMDVVSVANVGVITANATVTFPATGTWYEYYSGTTLEVTTSQTTIELAAADYRLYTSIFVPLPDGVVISSASEAVRGSLREVVVAPNPVSESLGVWLFLEKNARLRVEIRDQTGRLLQAPANYDLPEGEHQLSISSAQWSAGVYFVHLRDVEGGSVVRRVVKM
jgi:glycosidase